MPPNNDDLANASIFGGGGGGVVSGSTSGATVEPGEDITIGSDPAVGSTVWYVYTPLTDGHVILTTNHSGIEDTTLQAFHQTGSIGAYGSLEQVAENDDSAGMNNWSQVDFDVAAGEHYYLQVGGYDGEQGLLTLTETSGPPGQGPACYLLGTNILTKRGERPVQDLEMGEMVVTASGVAQPVKWIGRRSYAAALAQSDRVRPVCVRAGTLGGDLPRRDLWISPCHALLIDEMLIEARFLVNGSTITQPAVTEDFDYFHIELDTHDVVLAEGIPAETWLDRHSRDRFQNAEEFHALYPDYRPDPLARDYAFRPLGGSRLEAVRSRFVIAEAA